MISINYTSRKGFERTLKTLETMKGFDARPILERYGERGVKLLEQNTPFLTGKTASSWYYKIKRVKGGYTINWYNSNVNNGENIAILLEYGHGTRNGGYVAGRNYIRPTLYAIFDEMAKEIFSEVTKG